VTEMLPQELPDLESSAPDWALGLLLELPESFRVPQPVALKRPPDARRIADAIEAAAQVQTDWELARRRIMATILAEGAYAGTSYLRVDFWRRRKVLDGVGGIATALYEGRESDLRPFANSLLAVDLNGLPSATVSVMLAARAAALGLPVIEVVSGVVAAARQDCEERRGPGAAVSVERLASTRVTDVIVDCLEKARRANVGRYSQPV
jgi:hypothetical protein